MSSSKSSDRESSGRDPSRKERELQTLSQRFSNPMRNSRGDELLDIFNREKKTLEEKRANMAKEKEKEKEKEKSAQYLEGVELQPEEREVDTLWRRSREINKPLRESDKDGYRYHRRLISHYGKDDNKIDDTEKERRRILLGNYNARTAKAKQRASESYQKRGLSIREEINLPVQYLILDPQNNPNVEKLPPGPVHFGGKKRKTTKKRRINLTKKIKRKRKRKYNKKSMCRRR